MATCNDGLNTSTGLTPQAGDDLFNSSATGITEDSTGWFNLDVMANDRGGKAKSLYSLDNGAEVGDASAYSDLLAKDAIGSVQYSRLGAEIKITAEGKVAYHLTPGMNLQALAAGEIVTDTFTYAIKLGNGTLSWATASVQIIGVNDVALIGGVHAGDVTEDGANPLAAAGDLTIVDADAGQSHFAAQTAAGAYGSFALDAAGHWTYSADNALAAIQDLNTGDFLTDSFTARSSDGSADQLVTVTIHGVSDTVALPPVPTIDPNDFDAAITPASGTDGEDTLFGSSAADHYNGLGGDDTILGNGGGDTLYGGTGNDTMQGGAGADTLYGGSGDDIISGGVLNDAIYGGSGNDRITGNDAADTILGGLGQDSMTGAAGNDSFVFLNIYDSTVATPDTITDFTHGVDKLDLSAIDANIATGADDAFLFGGNDANTVAHSVTWTEVGADTIVSADVNGDTTADMQIVLTGTGLGLDSGDFIL